MSLAPGVALSLESAGGAEGAEGAGDADVFPVGRKGIFFANGPDSCALALPNGAIRRLNKVRMVNKLKNLFHIISSSF
jgi:hypothetical protein